MSKFWFEGRFPNNSLSQCSDTNVLTSSWLCTDSKQHAMHWWLYSGKKGFAILRYFHLSTLLLDPNGPRIPESHCRGPSVWWLLSSPPHFSQDTHRVGQNRGQGTNLGWLCTGPGLATATNRVDDKWEARLPAEFQFSYFCFNVCVNQLILS